MGGTPPGSASGVPGERHPACAGGPPDPVAKALNPAPYLRRAFNVDQPVVSARLYVTALGLYEARLNGRRVGDAFLTPGWTDYAHRIPYQTYDVTGLLNQGDNVLGAIIADGWYSGFYGFDAKRAGAHYGTAPELLAQLVITYADGSREWIVTDEQWRSADGAIRHADLLMGERHDLTLEPARWDAPGFDASGWRPVRVRDRDATPLVADPGPPVRVTQEIAPRSIATDDHGRHLVDFGQNLTGWLRLGVDGPAGAQVRIRHGEVLAADGTLYTENLRTARQTDEFTTGGGLEVLEPRFTLHGFRYAEISGYPGDIGQADIVARVVHSDIPAAGAFESSQPWLDKLARNIDWGQRGNFISVPTDCPQRDERLGWLGDAQVFARTACYNRDVAAFFAKWLDDVADAQLESGAFTDIAPVLSLRGAGAPAWGDAGVIVPWTVWKMYGDTGILHRHFGAMTRWMDYLERANPDYLRARGTREQLQRLAGSWRRRYPARAARDRLLGVRRRADGGDRRGDRPARRRRRVPGAVGQDPFGVRGRVRGQRRPYRLAHPDRVRARPAHESRPRGGPPVRRRSLGRGDPARGLASDHGVRGRRLPASGAERHWPCRRRVPAARAGVHAVLAVHGRGGRDHDLGAVGRLDQPSTASSPPG